MTKNKSLLFILSFFIFAGCSHKTPVPQDSLLVFWEPPTSLPMTYVTIQPVVYQQDVDRDLEAVKSHFSDDEANVFRSGRNIYIQLKGLDFASGQAEPRNYYLMNKVKNALREVNLSKLDIDGHADAQGPKTLNNKLSEERAENVKTYIIGDAGVAPANVTVTGYGASKPVATNSTKEGRSENRRVELKLTPQ